MIIDGFCVNHTLQQSMQPCCNLALAKKYSTTSSRPSCPLHVSDKSRTISLDAGANLWKLSVVRLPERIYSLSLWFVNWNHSLAASSNGVFPAIRDGGGYRKVTKHHRHVQDSHESTLPNLRVKRLLLSLEFSSHYFGTSTS